MVDRLALLIHGLSVLAGIVAITVLTLNKTVSGDAAVALIATLTGMSGTTAATNLRSRPPNGSGEHP